MADVRQEAKDASSCFFNDLWQLNGDRPRGAPSKEYKDGWRNYKEWQTSGEITRNDKRSAKMPMCVYISEFQQVMCV